jgi:hypothetical protein
VSVVSRVRDWTSSLAAEPGGTPGRPNPTLCTRMPLPHQWPRTGESPAGFPEALEGILESPDGVISNTEDER